MHYYIEIISYNKEFFIYVLFTLSTSLELIYGNKLSRETEISQENIEHLEGLIGLKKTQTSTFVCRANQLRVKFYITQVVAISGFCLANTTPV